ncbi:MAG TPA: patatin-like phospholipase family protein [Candidatus Obscuribacterales bacterium]
MTDARIDLLDRRVVGELSVVFGSGGSKAVLAGAGAVLAFHIGELKTFRTIGGVSGGSIPAALFAGGTDAATMLSQALQTDFSQLLTPSTGLIRRLLALLSKYRYEQTRPAKGVFSTEVLGRYIDGYVPRWPSNYWTLASVNGGSVLFTARGVARLAPHSKPSLLAAAPPSVGLSVQASCAIPGVIDAIRYHGEHLFDGALTEDGECPVDVPVREFGVQKSDLIAIDITEEAVKKSRWLRILWHIFCGGRCVSIDAVHPEEKDGLILVQPDIRGFHALQFKLNRDQKWHAVVASFIATVNALEKYGRIPESGRAALLTLRERLSAVDLKLIRKRAYAKSVERIIRELHPHLLPGSA